MDFTKLRIKNFLTIGDSGDIFLRQRGLNLLRGMNEDDPSAVSNGSGKSSIADALCWALFGETARGESSDAVVNATAKKDCEVSVTWEDGDVAYTVFRYRKHSTHKNDLFLTFETSAGGAGALTKGTIAETQAEIVRVLGCTHEVFVASIYAGQEAMPDLPALTDKPLKLLIEQASGSERLERAYEVARSQAQEVERRLTAARGQLSSANQMLGMVRRDVERAKMRRDEFESRREPQALDYERLAGEFTAEIAALEQRVANVDVSAVQGAISQISAQLASTNKLRVDAANYAAQVLQPAMSAVERQKAILDAHVAVAKHLRTEHDHAQQKLGAPCDACGKPHTEEDIAPVRELAKKKLIAKIEEIQQLQLKQRELDQAMLAADQEHKRLESLVPNVSALNVRLHQLNEALTAIASINSEVEQKRRQFAIANQEAVRFRTAPNPHLEELEDAVKKATAAIDAVKNAEAMVAGIERELQIAQDVLKVFSPAGVRAHILDTVTPFLNARTAEYLSVLSDGNISAVWSTLTRNAKGEAKEKFAIDVEHAKGGKKYKLLSGGEKGKVRLACMLALQDLVASRAVKPINLWIGDEVDGPLDPNGLERLMAILEKRARERGTVIVVSHRELRDWIDDVTVVTKEGGLSKVEGALCQR